MNLLKPTGRRTLVPSDFDDYVGTIEPYRADCVQEVPLLQLALVDVKAVISNIIALMKLDEECHINKECGRLPDLYQSVKAGTDVYIVALKIAFEHLEGTAHPNKIPSSIASFGSLAAASSFLKVVHSGLRDRGLLPGLALYISEASLECLFNTDRTLEKLRSMTECINVTISSDPEKEYDCEIREFSPEFLEALIQRTDISVIDQLRALPCDERHLYRCLSDASAPTRIYHWKGTPHSYNQTRQSDAGLPLFPPSNFDFSRAVVSDSFLIESLKYNEILDPVDFISGGEHLVNAGQSHSFNQLEMQWIRASTEKVNSSKRKHHKIEVSDMRSVVLPQLQWLRAVQQNIQENEIPRVVVVPLYGMWFRFEAVHENELKEFPRLRDDIVYRQWYISVRDSLVRFHRSSPGEYMTQTLARRLVSGTDDGIEAIHAFLSKWGLLNYKTSMKGFSSELNETEFGRVQKKVGRQSSSSGPAWTVEEELTLTNTASGCDDVDGFKEVVSSDAHNYELARTVSECLSKYAAMDIEKFPYKSHASLKGTQALGALVSRACHFLNSDTLDVQVRDAALEALGENADGDITYSGLASATLGVCQAKALILAQEERANLEALMLKALHLQSKKLQLQLSLLEQSAKDTNAKLNNMPHEWYSMYQHNITRKVQLENLLKEDEGDDLRVSIDM
eukprot:TRINITY_DN19388_c0_g1_i2.p1 TRINITY_DN19388_c0_g1~~TRINITY_DN19388_c0_g1_i2.p1  ORF type:complete len:705 (+),score=121.56 TRINITY_DN19388_c0_g1_i2:78-2117(+)